MHKSEKERVIAELTERLRASPTLIVADYRGLSMPEIDGLRGELLKHGARFSVVKNTLTRRAAEAAGSDAVLAMLEGPTAIAFLESEGDPVAVAKALADAVRTTKVLVIRGGVLDGKTISADDVDSLAKLPPTDVLRAQLLGALAGPLVSVVGIFAAPLRDLVGVIDARIEQLKEQGDTSAPEPEPDVLMSTSEPEPEAQVEEQEQEPEQEPEVESPSDEAQED
jgi:large subunit ribosomal protein L10